MQKSNIINAQDHTESCITEEIVALAKQKLKQQGWVLLRGFENDIDKFSSLVSQFCNKLSFDPARESSSTGTQKVDAGTDAVGLHIENGNTPFPPELVAFYSRKSAKTGSQTTLCDGSQVFNAMSAELQQLFSQQVTASRTLPESLWKTYIANEHPQLNDPQQVTSEHLQQIMQALPGQKGELSDRGELHYSLSFSPVLISNGQRCFANAILGPSFNYEAPVYRFENGRELTDALKAELASLAEKFTLELSWQDGDMVLIDNTRVMHGRRPIEGDPAQRQLVIAMGRN